MSRLRKKSSDPPNISKAKKSRALGATLENVEGRMISLTMKLAEKQLLDGTASSQVMNHFLRQGSTTAKLEKEKLQAENDLLKAKVEALQSHKRVEVLYSNALKAMRTYSGQESDS